MTEMFTTPASIGSVTIRAIDHVKQRIRVAIALDVESEGDLMRTDARLQAHHKLQAALKYLFDEGFVKQPIVVRSIKEPKSHGKWDVAVFAEMKTNQ